MSTNVGTIRGELGGDSSRWVAMMREARAALSRLTGETRELDAGLSRSARASNQARDALGRFSKQAEQAGVMSRKLGEVSKLQAAVGIYAVARAIRESVSAFADFNKAATEVSAITGNLGNAGAGGVESLQQSMLELSQTTEFTASEVADAYKFLARSGLEVNEVMAAAPATMQLASAAMLDVGRAADISTNIMKGMRLTVDDLAHVNDVLVKTATSSNNSVEQLGEAFSHVGPVAASAGVDLESVSAALGALGDAGLQGERGGTALKGMITKLLAPSREATKIMESFGISIDQSTFQAEGFAGVIEKLGPLAGQTGALMEIFGQRAGPGAAVLISAGADAVRSLERDLHNAGGTAETIANAQINSLGGQINIMKSNLEGAAIAVGQSFEPALRGLIPVINSVLQGIKWLAEDFLTLKFLFEEESSAPSQAEIMAEKIAIQKRVVEGIKQKLDTMEQDGVDDVTASRYAETINRLIFAEERLAELRKQGGESLGRQLGSPGAAPPPSSVTVATTATSPSSAAAAEIVPSVDEVSQAVGEVVEAAESQVQIGSSLVAEMESRAAMEGKTRVSLEEFEENLRRASGETERLEIAAASTAVGMLDIVAMAARGNFGAAGSALGGMVGGAIGTAAGGAAGGILGEALGSLLGGVLGSVIEELVSVLGTLTPLFDAFAVVIRALAPIFLVLGVFVAELATTIELLAPSIHPLAEGLAVMLLVVVRVASVFLTMYDWILVLNQLALNMTQIFVTFAQVIDERVLIPLVNGVTIAYNGFVALNNQIIESIRRFTGDQGFGLLLAERELITSSVIGDFATSDEEIAAYGQESALRDNTSAIREFTRSLTNVPTGYRVALTEYMTERPQRRGAQAVMAASNGAFNIRLVSRDGNVYEQQRSHNMRTRGALFGGGFGGGGSN